MKERAVVAPRALGRWGRSRAPHGDQQGTCLAPPVSSRGPPPGRDLLR